MADQNSSTLKTAKNIFKKNNKKHKEKGEAVITQREPKLKFKRVPGKREPNNNTAGSTMIWQQKAI